MYTHPIQPLVLDENNTVRFKSNAIVQYLLELSDLNRLYMLGFSTEDWTQFYQLIGYSVSGFCELSKVDPNVADLCQSNAKALYDSAHVVEFMKLKAEIARLKAAQSFDISFDGMSGVQRPNSGMGS